MELKHVKIFVLAANLLNFTKVAEFSFLSQSSVTKYIQCLEEELGGKLFLRDGRKTELTELGKLFLPYASSLLDTEQESMAALRSYQSGLERTTFRIGVEDALAKAGARNGDEIRIVGRAFEFESATADDAFEELDI